MRSKGLLERSQGTRDELERYVLAMRCPWKFSRIVTAFNINERASQ